MKRLNLILIGEKWMNIYDTYDHRHHTVSTHIMTLMSMRTMIMATMIMAILNGCRLVVHWCKHLMVIVMICKQKILNNLRVWSESDCVHCALVVINIYHVLHVACDPCDPYLSLNVSNVFFFFNSEYKVWSERGNDVCWSERRKKRK